MKKTVIIFSLLILALLLLFKVGNYQLISGNTTTEIIMSIIAIIFFLIGIFIHKKSRPTIAEQTHEIDHEKIKKLEISNREYEVLQSISEGLSNKEIAEKLFVSESTIKTHVSSLLVKLNAKRRTQAIQIAKDIQIL